MSNLVTPRVEQCCIIKFLMKEKVKPAEILHRFNAQYGEGTLSCVSALICTMIFPKALKSLRPTACSCSANIYMLHDHLSRQWVVFGKWGKLQCIIIASSWTCWNRYPWTLDVQGTACPVVPKCVTVWPEGELCCCVCRTSASVSVGGWRETPLELTVTCDETWVHFFTPVSKQPSMKWHYSKLVHSDVYQAFWKTRPVKLQWRLSYRMTTLVYPTANLTKRSLVTMDWEIKNHRA
jgi:hypothetical protein